MSNPEITIRAATKDDRKDFMRMWRLFLQEEYDMGGELLPNEANAQEGLRMFQSYVQGSLHGLVMLGYDGDKVVCMNLLGENYNGGFRFESRYGRTFHSWASYVLPEHRRSGLCHRMLDYAQDYFRELGFDGCSFFVKFAEDSMANAVNFGSSKVAVQMFHPIERVREKK